MKSGIEFELLIDGQLDKKWGDYFNIKEMEYRDGKTALHGALEDQSAVINLLNKIHGMGFVLLSFQRIEAGKQTYSIGSM